MEDGTMRMMMAGSLNGGWEDENDDGRRRQSIDLHQHPPPPLTNNPTNYPRAFCRLLKTIGDPIDRVLASAEADNSYLLVASDQLSSATWIHIIPDISERMGTEQQASLSLPTPHITIHSLQSPFNDTEFDSKNCTSISRTALYYILTNNQQYCDQIQM